MRTTVDTADKEVAAIKRVIARSLRSRLKEKGATVASLARDTGTSRTAIRRVLDQKNTSITLSTIVRTANSLGYRLRLSMEPVIEKVERVHTPKKVAPLMDELGQALDELPKRWMDIIIPHKIKKKELGGQISDEARKIFEKLKE